MTTIMTRMELEQTGEETGNVSRQRRGSKLACLGFIKEALHLLKFKERHQYSDQHSNLTYVISATASTERKEYQIAGCQSEESN